MVRGLKNEIDLILKIEELTSQLIVGAQIKVCQVIWGLK